MQAKRRYEAVFEVNPCGNCGAFGRLDKNDHCFDCQDQITADIEDFYDDKDLERILGNHAIPLHRRLWQWALAQRQKDSAGKGVQ